MGDVPERAVFLEEGFNDAMKPYLAMTKTVRSGNVTEFERCKENNRVGFMEDGTYVVC